MFGARHTGFDWKEVAEVLLSPRVADPGAFWREIRRSMPKREEVQSPAIAIPSEHSPDTEKVGKPGGSP
jgi:hypothetical protein